jgi:hypothetical protein
MQSVLTALMEHAKKSKAARDEIFKKLTHLEQFTTCLLSLAKEIPAMNNLGDFSLAQVLPTALQMYTDVTVEVKKIVDEVDGAVSSIELFMESLVRSPPVRAKLDEAKQDCLNSKVEVLKLKLALERAADIIRSCFEQACRDIFVGTEQ